MPQAPAQIRGCSHRIAVLSLDRRSMPQSIQVVPGCVRKAPHSLPAMRVSARLPRQYPDRHPLRQLLVPEVNENHCQSYRESPSCGSKPPEIPCSASYSIARCMLVRLETCLTGTTYI